MVQAKEDADRRLKTATRAAWALGAYHHFALETVWGLQAGAGGGVQDLRRASWMWPRGPAARASAPPRPGPRSWPRIYTRELPSGSTTSQASGVELDWVEAVREQLPFDDRQFDVVLSSFRAMFACNHQAVAELVQVSGPSMIGMLNFARGPGGRLLFESPRALRATTPAGALSPLSGEHVRGCSTGRWRRWRR